MDILQAEKRKKKLTKRLEAVMLRRTKEEKLADQLPKKLDFICVCRLSDLQYRAYMCGTGCHTSVTQLIVLYACSSVCNAERPEPLVLQSQSADLPSRTLELAAMPIDMRLSCGQAGAGVARREGAARLSEPVLLRLRRGRPLLLRRVRRRGGEEHLRHVAAQPLSLHLR